MQNLAARRRTFGLVALSLLVLISSDAPATGSTDLGRTIEPMDGGSGGDGGDGGYTDGGTMDGGQSGVPCVETEWPLSEVAAPVDLAEVWPIFEGWAPSGPEST